MNKYTGRVIAIFTDIHALLEPIEAIINDINKPIDINRLSKGKQYDLNELLQWIYGYYLNSKDNMREICDHFATQIGKCPSYF